MSTQPFQSAAPEPEIAGDTDRGMVRPQNEDSYVILQGSAVPNWCSAVVGIFDGVGGLDNGQEASPRSARYLAELLLGPPLQQLPPLGPKQAVTDLARGLLLRSALEMKSRGHESWDVTLWSSAPIQQGAGVLVSAALDVDDMEKERGEDPDLRGAFADAYSMLWLQYSLAKDAEQLEGGLRRAGPSYTLTPGLSSEDPDVTAPVHVEPPVSRDAVAELTTQAQTRVNEVHEQLEAFLPALRALKKHDVRSYQFAAAELSRETADVLARIQARAG